MMAAMLLKFVRLLATYLYFFMNSVEVLGHPFCLFGEKVYCHW